MMHKKKDPFLIIAVMDSLTVTNSQGLVIKKISLVWCYNEMQLHGQAT